MTLILGIQIYCTKNNVRLTFTKLGPDLTEENEFFLEPKTTLNTYTPALVFPEVKKTLRRRSQSAYDLGLKVIKDLQKYSLTEIIKELKISSISIKGTGPKRTQILKGIEEGCEYLTENDFFEKVSIASIIESTPNPHNGCRGKKPRRK